MNCIYCGKEFKIKRRPDQVTCGGEACKKILQRERSKIIHREKAKEREEQRNRKRNETLTQIAIKARACGMSYGQYVAMYEKV